MNTRTNRSQGWHRLQTLLLLPSAFILLPSLAFSAGFTEPPVIFYGQVNQTYNGYTIPVSSGTLRWTVQSTAAGSSPVASTALPGVVSGVSFYRLEIPVQKLPAGFTLSPNTISTASATFNRGTITLDGAPVSIVYPTGTDRGTFTFSEVARGKMDRVDLSLTTPFLDSDGDGIPDWWEDKYGLDKYDPTDANGLDAYGRRWLDNYNNHVDPTAPVSEYAAWTMSNTLQGSAADPAVDADNDGVPNMIEFALGTNPKVADNALAAQRSQVQVEAISGTKYLTLTVQKPGRTTANYVVEASSDMVTWSSVEGTAIVTITNNASTLKVRTKNAVDASAGGRTYLRLRVGLTQS